VTSAQLILYGATAALYLFVVLSGLLFADNERYPKPLLIALSVQIPWISTPFLGFRFTAGFHVTVGVIGGQFDGGYLLGSDWQLTLMSNLPWGIGVNLCALVFFLLLLISSRDHRSRVGYRSESKRLTQPIESAKSND
jgi:hypothetical protein